MFKIPLPYITKNNVCSSCYVIVECLCWGLVLKCYELRTRQHKKKLMVNVLHPSKHYFP
jgi:hypothetical protein